MFERSSQRLGDHNMEMMANRSMRLDDDRSRISEDEMGLNLMDMQLSRNSSTELPAFVRNFSRQSSGIRGNQSNLFGQ